MGKGPGRTTLGSNQAGIDEIGWRVGGSEVNIVCGAINGFARKVFEDVFGKALIAVRTDLIVIAEIHISHNHNTSILRRHRNSAAVVGHPGN